MSAEKLKDEEFELEDDFEIDIEDDTPEEDRGRTKAAADDDDDDEIEDEELKNYSAGAAKRIKTLTRQKHDQRRAREDAERQLNEATSVIQKMRQQLQGAAKSVVGTNKVKLETDLGDLKKQMAAAVETGDGEKIAEISEKIATTRTALDNTLHTEKRLGEQNENEDQPDPNDQSNWPAARKKWAKANAGWFHKDEEMTGYVYGLHQKLIRKGVVVDSQEYYDAIDSKMRKMFPDEFEGQEEEDVEDEEVEETPKPRRSESRAAPGLGGGAGSKKGQGKKKVIKLKQSQIDLCNRLGITPKQYVEEMLAKEEQ